MYNLKTILIMLQAVATVVDTVAVTEVVECVAVEPVMCDNIGVVTYSFWLLVLALIVLSLSVIKVILIVKFWRACNSIERLEKRFVQNQNSHNV